MGIRHIEIELQAVPSIVTEYGDALSPAIDPAAKLPVPALHLQNRRSVRTLGVDEDLLIERAFVVVTGRAEKARPALIAAGDALHGLVILLNYQLKFVLFHPTRSFLPKYSFSAS